MIKKDYKNLIIDEDVSIFKTIFKCFSYAIGISLTLSAMWVLTVILFSI